MIAYGNFIWWYAPYRPKTLITVYRHIKTVDRDDINITVIFFLILYVRLIRFVSISYIYPKTKF